MVKAEPRCAASRYGLTLGTSCSDLGACTLERWRNWPKRRKNCVRQKSHTGVKKQKVIFWGTFQQRC